MSDKELYLIHTVRIAYPINVGGFENYPEDNPDEGKILETEARHLSVVLDKLNIGSVKISSVLIDRKPKWYES